MAQLQKPQQFYPKPGPVGGRLIRQVISFLKDQQFALPSASHILIACSGGSDSMALGHLLAHYGRRVADKEKLRLLHINHRWRGEESDRDAEFVEACGKLWGVPVIMRKLKTKPKNDGQSWEENAREARKKIYAEEVARFKKSGALVFTAHQADDLAETLIWRLFTGNSLTHGGGIAFRHEHEVRPLLRVRKQTLQLYLEEESSLWREDPTNLAGRFQRSKMRLELMPVIERLFPKSVNHLVNLALQAQSQVKSQNDSTALEMPQALFQAAGIKARRPHWEALSSSRLLASPGEGELHLPGGWKLRHEGRNKKSSLVRSGNSRSTERAIRERWVLEKISYRNKKRKNLQPGSSN